MAKPKKTSKKTTRTAAAKPAAKSTDAMLAPDVLERIAVALERLAPSAKAAPDLDAADAFIWHPDGRLVPVPRVNRVEMSLLKGVDRVRDTLVENTERFARGLPANNALLWGARGMGKSSLVKASHAAVNAEFARKSERGPLKLVEIHREDIESLPELMAVTRTSHYRFIVFCDDLSFDADDTSYKSLKAVLEGGIEGRPENVIFYATSNRRHLLSRDMIENERSSAINPGASSRFGAKAPTPAQTITVRLHREPRVVPSRMTPSSPRSSSSTSSLRWISAGVRRACSSQAATKSFARIRGKPITS